MESFANYYNYRRYPEEVLDNVTPADVYYIQREQILAQTKEVKQQILTARKNSYPGEC
jgi:hypothetical protein